FLFIRLVKLLSLSCVAVVHGDEAQTVRRCARTRHRAILRRHDLLERRCVDLATSDPEERPHDRPDHSPEERIRRDLETELSFVVLAPFRASDGANTPRS